MMDASSRTDNHSKSHVDQLVKTNRELQQKIDGLQRENKQLKKSIYDLSVRYDNLAAEKSIHNGRAGGPKMQPFDLDAIFATSGPDISENDTAAIIDEPVTAARLDVKGSGKLNRDGRLFSYKHTLKGHTGAVYTAQYSHDGRLLATGSFDNTVRLWDTHAHKKERILEGHELLVTQVSWGSNDTRLMSSSFDATVKLWDVASGEATYTSNIGGFVQCCTYSPVDDKIGFAGSSKSFAVMIDFRQPPTQHARKFENDVMINALYVYRDGLLLTTGDAGGCIKTWDIRTGTCIDSTVNEDLRMPISHICVPGLSTSDEQEERFMAVNSHDNVLRVYDRGTMPPQSGLHLKVALKGHVNKNWQIRSSFYYGSNYTATWDRAKVRNEETKAVSRDEPRTVHDTILLATGSADAKCYLFDLGPENCGELVQCLEGHTDKVYSVDFHPTEPLLATASADSTVRIWTAKAKRVVHSFAD